MSNTEIVKWIELWLDSAGERVYQPAFVSALAHQGYQILHNTSHTSLELGKDVVCIGPNSELYAFQLKGNPGSRLTMGQWHALQNQVLQLVTIPIPKSVRGNRHPRHTPVLVTNGEIDEDVQAAIANFNQEFVSQYQHCEPLVVWNRGQLLTLFSSVAASIWPTSIENQIRLLKAVTLTAEDTIEERDIQAIVTDSLSWSDRPSMPASLSRIAGTATAMSIATSKHYGEGNLFEVVKAKSITLGLVAGYRAKYRLNTTKHKRLYKVLRDELSDLLVEFSCRVADVFKERDWINHAPMFEFGIVHTRRLTVVSLLATCLLEQKDALPICVRDIVVAPLNYPFLDAERVIPAFLAIFWAKQNALGSSESEKELVEVLKYTIILSRNGRFPASYYSLGEVAAWKHAAFLGRLFHEIHRDQRQNMSQFAYALVCLLAKRNWKVSTKMYWPDVTRLVHSQTRLEDANEFAFYRGTNAKEESRLIPIPETWDGLIKKLRKTPRPKIPELMLSDPILTLLITIFLPYRADEKVVLWLDREFCETWH